MQPAMLAVGVLLLLQQTDAFLLSSARTRGLSPRSFGNCKMSSTDELEAKITEMSADCAPLNVQPTFQAMASDEKFIQQLWQREPFVVKSELNNLKGCYLMEDVRIAVDDNFLEAGRGSFQEGKSGWNMAAVSTPRGSSFQEAKLQYTDVLEALQQKNGTVVINSAGGFIPKLAEVCLTAVNALRLPVAINMYLTNPGQRTSAPPHTDKQDVFVMQTSGYKHWRVFAPPEPSKMFRADPHARGKSKDVLALEELSEPLVETTLRPGQLLYIPAGFPHTTDTINDIPADSDPSVHLTIGVDTLIWGLTYGGLRDIAMRRAGLEDKLVPTKLPNDVYWDLQNALPVGFLADPIIAPHRGSGPNMRQALFSEMSAGLLRRMRAAEPARWGESDEETAQLLRLDEVLPRLVQHHAEVTDLFGKLYEDVAYKITPAKMDLSLFRSQPYFRQLEGTMQGLYDWADEGKKSAPSAENEKNGLKEGKKAKTTAKGGFGSS